MGFFSLFVIAIHMKEIGKIAKGKNRREKQSDKDRKEEEE